MKNMIISKKTREEKMLLESIVDTTTPAEVVEVSSFINLARRFNQAMSNADLDAAKKLRLTDIKKY